MNPLISVIIPVFNTEDYLEKCIESVRRQTFHDLEIILVDDGSGPLASLMCDHLASEESRIRVIHQANQGLSAARNTGIRYAKGTYLSFIDSDDYISPTFYEDLISLAGENVIPVSHFVRVDSLGHQFLRKDPHISGGVVTSEKFLEELLLHIGDVSVCTKLFHRELIGRSRFQEGKLNEDLLFILSLLYKIDHFVFTGRVGYYYLSREGSISNRYGKSVEDMVDNALLVLDFTKSNYPSLEQQSWRFSLFQNLAYLLLVPEQLRCKNNVRYNNSISFVRRNFLKHGLFNRYLTIKDKIILVGLIFFPGTMAFVYQMRHS